MWHNVQATVKKATVTEDLKNKSLSKIHYDTRYKEVHLAYDCYLIHKINLSYSDINWKVAIPEYNWRNFSIEWQNGIR